MKAVLAALCVFLVAVQVHGMPSALKMQGMTKFNQANAAGCCLPATSFQYNVFQTTACWDIHGNAAGYMQGFGQEDLNNQLWYMSQLQVSPAPVETGYEFWFTPGAVQGTWFQFIRPIGQPTCYVQNFTSVPNVFRKPCWQEPDYVYGGDVQIGSHAESVFNHNGGNYNTTTFIDMSSCIPTTELGFGINDNGDWEERESLYVNPKFSVDDPSKFIPPTGCRPLADAPHLLAAARKLPVRPTFLSGAW